MKKDTRKQKRMSKDELAEYKEECDKNLAGWQRAKADYENLKKRTAQEKADIALYANAEIFMEILPIVDNFQSAYGNVPKDLEGNNWVEGIRFIKEQMEKFLADNEIEVIKAVGEKFDPELHEAVENIESNKEKGTVVEEVVKGYQFKDKVIRPAKVKVATGDGADKDADNANKK